MVASPGWEQEKDELEDGVKVAVKKLFDFIGEPDSVTFALDDGTSIVVRKPGDKNG